MSAAWTLARYMSWFTTNWHHTPYVVFHSKSFEGQFYFDISQLYIFYNWYRLISISHLNIQVQNLVTASWYYKWPLFALHCLHRYILDDLQLYHQDLIREMTSACPSLFTSYILDDHQDLVRVMTSACPSCDCGQQGISWMTLSSCLGILNDLCLPFIVCISFSWMTLSSWPEEEVTTREGIPQGEQLAAILVMI